jgi:lipopolysaccharide transport system ATP-binding protein
MAQPVISVDALGKHYFLSHQKRQDSLRESLTQGFRALRDRLRGAPVARSDTEEFWALHDITFTINQGDIVGIIGRNGAGKSTLLKILSRITEPTRGRAVIRGRVASLLEVGTGFHPELTGRENIYLNGAILGMSRTEITRKFDEIVAFAEVERFLDTQVKHYSSGMHVRLAFAVAAHLEPEILIVDEVLAVGDADFQRKCLRKMNDVTRQEGRTILFVSHQLTSIQQLCNRVIVLNRGALTHDTTTAAGITAYLTQKTEPEAASRLVRFGPELKLISLELAPDPVNVFADLGLVLRLQADAACRIHDLCLLVHNEQGQRVAIADLRQSAKSYELAQGEHLVIRGTLQRLALIPGTYKVGFYVRTNVHVEDHQLIKSFEVHLDSDSGLISYPREHMGSVALDPIFTPEIEPGHS